MVRWRWRAEGHTALVTLFIRLLHFIECAVATCIRPDLRHGFLYCDLLYERAEVLGMDASSSGTSSRASCSLLPFDSVFVALIYYRVRSIKLLLKLPPVAPHPAFSSSSSRSFHLSVLAFTTSVFLCLRPTAYRCH